MVTALFTIWVSLTGFSPVVAVQPHPALIPLPQQVEWDGSSFPLSSCRGIVVKDRSLALVARELQGMLTQMGWSLSIAEKKTGACIELRLGNVEAPQSREEAYHLQVTADRVLLIANTPHGMFNALQTLRQLMRDGATLPSCTITDWPAFAWRGYMVDVGRNYLSPALLKQQVDVMARYKLNIFHLHLTEDIAWRLQIRQYPQLTEAATMLRDPGQYYTVGELKDLIEYCKERFITLVPEIDMPGHSAAFSRAMKTGMQTDSGINYIKHIIKEVVQTYDLPYLHIGADEVKITNPRFLPDVLGFAGQFGVKMIGWQPGGNYPNCVIRQLWMDDAGKDTANARLQYIDSRHLYLNHLDPLEAVTTLFFRQIGNQEKGDDRLMGATLCLWPDRRVSDQQQVLIQNPVYPGILTFAERTWRGGGSKGWTATIGEPNSSNAEAFREFEGRLCDHQKQYFTILPFPYTPQSSTVWTLYGPYNNEGTLSAAFAPETNHFDTAGLPKITRVVGGTIVLRHWWYPLIKGAIDHPGENTTVYASTRIWSDSAGWSNFWIGFNNLSRSPASDSPPDGAWDNRESCVWVNGSIIAPPHWKHGGQKGNPEIPLFDEGYEYRPPTRIFLQKGWNTVWIKAPVGGFKGRDWQNPVKWMFTCVPTIQ